MEKNKDFRAFRYGDHLEPGHSLKIEHSITCEQTDLSSLIAKGEDQLDLFDPVQPSVRACG